MQTEKSGEQADSTPYLVRASWVAIVGNTLLAAAKIVAGIVSGSLAVLADGIDSASDIVTSVITLFISRILNRPPNIRFPFGYRRADTIATKALSFIIFFAGAQLAISTIHKLIENETSEIPGKLALAVTLISIASKFGLSLYLFRQGKKYGSAMHVANARNMRNDVIISISVLVGLFLTFVLEMPLFDRVTALIVSVWIMKVGFDIFMESNIELMDGSREPELYEKLFAVVNRVEGVHNPHRARVRRIGNLFVIDLDIEVDGSMPVGQGHEIATRVEKEIKTSLENIYDVMVHVEPLGHKHNPERYGIDENIIGKLH